MARPEPTLDVEREFFANGARIVAGMDEVVVVQLQGLSLLASLLLMRM